MFACLTMVRGEVEAIWDGRHSFNLKAEITRRQSSRRATEPHGERSRERCGAVVDLSRRRRQDSQHAKLLNIPLHSHTGTNVPTPCRWGLTRPGQGHNRQLNIACCHVASGASAVLEMESQPSAR